MNKKETKPLEINEKQKQDAEAGGKLTLQSLNKKVDQQAEKIQEQFNDMKEHFETLMQITVEKLMMAMEVKQEEQDMQIPHISNPSPPTSSTLVDPDKPVLHTTGINRHSSVDAGQTALVVGTQQKMKNWPVTEDTSSQSLGSTIDDTPIHDANAADEAVTRDEKESIEHKDEKRRKQTKEDSVTEHQADGFRHHVTDGSEWRVKNMAPYSCAREVGHIYSMEPSNLHPPTIQAEPPPVSRLLQKYRSERHIWHMNLKIQLCK